MTVRELRQSEANLRRRVDVLTAQRDAARADAELYHGKSFRYRQYLYEARRNRDLWKHRALQPRGK